MNKNLLDAMLKAKKSLGVEFNEVEEVKAYEELSAKREAEMQTKANEVMNTGATGFGTELVPTNVLLDPMLDLVPNYSRLLPMLPGNQGSNLPVSAKVPIIGEADLFSGNTEWTTGSGALTPADQGPDTGEITITQGQFILSVAVSYRELNYALGNLETIIRERINRDAARTIDAYIINADSATSGNVNTSATPTSTLYYMQGNGGIRDLVIADTNTYTIGDLQESDFTEILGKLGSGYQTELTSLLWIMPYNVYNKCLNLGAVLTVDKFGPNATFATGVLGKIFGIDVLVARDFPALALATGKVHASTGNDYGSMALIYKPAVQYGFGMPLKIDVQPRYGKGVIFIATFEFGFAIAYDKAGLGKTAAMGIGMNM